MENYGLILSSNENLIKTPSAFLIFISDLMPCDIFTSTVKKKSLNSSNSITSDKKINFKTTDLLHTLRAFRKKREKKEMCSEFGTVCI